MSFFSDIFSGAGGDIIGAISNIWAGDRSEKSSAANRQVSIDQFNSQMDETLQRRVADGLKAGINPLAAIGASANVQPTVHTAGGDDSSSFISRAGEHLANLFRRKQEDDVEYNKEAQDLDIEEKRLRNRILQNQVAESDMNLAQKTEVPNIQPNRLGDNPLFSIAYDLQDRPRLVVNQNVMESDSDNAGYVASIKHAIAQGFVDKITGQITSDQYRMMLEDMYYNMTGRHIHNADQLYFSPAEAAAAAANLARGI